MRQRIIVSDADGTYTDLHKAHHAVRDEVARQLAERFRLDVGEVQTLMFDEWDRRLLAPAQYAYVLEGRELFSATSDPMSGLVLLAKHAVEELGHRTAEAARAVDELIWSLVDGVTPPFRPDADDYLVWLNEVGGHIVTGSPTHVAVRRLQEFSRGNGRKSARACDALVQSGRLHAGVRKWAVGDGLHHLAIDGLSRRVSMDRPEYRVVLEAILQEHGADWGDLAVISDQLEVDLMFPFNEGADVYLYRTPSTPDYELDWVRAHEGTHRVHLAHSLADIIYELS